MKKLNEMVAGLERLASIINKDYPAVVRAGRRVGIKKLAALSVAIDDLLGVSPGKAKGKK